MRASRDGARSPVYGSAAVLVLLCLGGCRTPGSGRPTEKPAGVLPAEPLGPPPPPPRKAGLQARLDDGKTVVELRVDAPNFTLAADESLHPALAPAFDAEWNGQLNVIQNGTYRFWVDPARLSVDGRPVGTAPMELAPGPHAIQLTYHRAPGPARLQLQWSSESFAREPVPARLLSSDGWSHAAERWLHIDRGRTLVDEMGCRGCHAAEGQTPSAGGVGLGQGPILTMAGTRLLPAWIYKWLEDPARHRAGARMPRMPLSGQDRADVTAFLGTLLETGNTTNASFVPEVPEQPLTEDERKEARQLFATIGCSACHGDGVGQTPLAGLGSKYRIAGLMRVLMSPNTILHVQRMPSLFLEDSTRGRQDDARVAGLLVRLLASERNPEFEQQPPPGNAARGREIVQRSGCIGCHDVALGGKPVASHMHAPPLGRLSLRPNDSGGCLPGGAPVLQSVYRSVSLDPGGPPHYRFDQLDRDDIALYLDSVGEVSDAPAWALERTIGVLGCRNCHETQVPAHHAFDDKPPSLGEVGNKLLPAWIDDVIGSYRGPRIRPWLKLRMPRYRDLTGTGRLLAAAAGAETEASPTAAVVAPGDRIVKEGVQFLGRGEAGMSCIVCHRFQSFDPQSATPAPDLTTVTQRLRPTWFDRWLRDPLRMQEGTQMPAYFMDAPEEFKSARIETLWKTLALGKGMPAPEGVDLKGGIPLLPGKRPLVVRSFLKGGGSRSILVGFPERAFAFDAETCRLQFAWKGSFVDMQPAWTGRGGNAVTPLGPVFYQEPKGQSLRVGTLDGPVTVRFRGYDLDRGGVPTFRYDLGDASVSERITFARPPALGIVRTINVTATGDKPPADLWFVQPAQEGVRAVVSGARPDGEGGDGKKFHATLKGRRAVRIVVQLNVDAKPDAPAAGVAREVARGVTP